MSLYRAKLTSTESGPKQQVLKKCIINNNNNDDNNNLIQIYLRADQQPEGQLEKQHEQHTGCYISNTLKENNKSIIN